MSDKRHSATQNPDMRAAIATGQVRVMKDNGKPRKLGIPFADPKVVGEVVPPFLQAARPADLTPMQVQMHTIEWRLKSMVWREMSRQNRLLLGPGPLVIERPVPEAQEPIDFTEWLNDLRRAHGRKPLAKAA